MILPLIAAFTLAASFIGAKEVLSRLNMGNLIYTFWVFVGLAGWMLLAFPFFYLFSPGMFSGKYLLLFIGIIVIAFFYNLVLYRGLKYETLNESELIIMATPLFSTFLSYYVFVDERNLAIAIPTIIASLVLLWSHYENRHITFSKAGKFMLAYAFLYSVESLFIKEILNVWSPFMLYFFRCSALLVFLGLYIKPTHNGANFKQKLYAILTALPAIITYVLIYWSYSINGIIFTNLILILAPVLIMSYAFLVRKEKIKIKRIIAGIVVLISVAVGLLLSM